MSLKKKLLSIFILFNIVAVMFSSSAPQSFIEKIFNPYLVWTRLNQSWRLFTPTPRKLALKYRADILLKDGSQKSWQRPYPDNWDFFNRHLAYNFQKWDLASNYLDQYSMVRLDLAHFLTREFWSDENPPTKVTLIRMVATIPPPNESGYVMHDDSELQWRDRTVFVYNVAEQKFE